nr:ribonuclease H-like YkuK family protein [Caldalkalibacillus salinus]
MSLQEITYNIQTFIEEDPKAKYKIVIGTDSQTVKNKTTFVSALIVHREGKGARFFYRKLRVKRIPDLRSRIYKETELSLNLIDHLKEKGIVSLLQDWPIEVHIDVGQHGETRMLIQEVVGWVTAVGYEAIIKPHSFGASSVADKFTG